MAMVGQPRASIFSLAKRRLSTTRVGWSRCALASAIQVSGVLVDFLSIAEEEGHLVQALANSGSIAPLPVLVYLKLKSPRAKDRVDLIELVKAGADVESCRNYVVRHAPELLAKWEECVAVASTEE
jgi:hypothetical protein